MRKKVLIFVCVALFTLSVVPAINLTFGVNKKKVGEKWWSRSVLYNVDFALPFLSHFFYPLGVSLDPNQVMIGKNGWLFLGDQYDKTITVKRRGATQEDAVVTKKIGHATELRERWLKRKGVRLYRVMLGPDKSTIYSEFLPDWARPAPNSVTNMLLANVDREVYVDTRLALITAKAQFQEPLYYKTDTHWNRLGAWVAYRALAMNVARVEKGLFWLSDKQVHVSKVTERKGGDLANFLRMTDTLRDKDIFMEIGVDSSVETKQYDFETGKLISSGGNPAIGAPDHPLLVKSKHALNNRRVLWLRDSFGTSLAPFMAATFSETLQLHYDATDSASFARLVEAYKPDYVFVTAVERDSRGQWFENFAL